MADQDRQQRPYLLCGGVCLVVLGASLVTFTQWQWRGLLGWDLILVALALMGVGVFRGKRWRP